MEKEAGITLTELLVVTSIIAILVIAFGFSYQGWMGKYRVESQIKEIYADLMDARSRAITRNHWYFVLLNTNKYQATEDTDDSLGTAPNSGDTTIWSSEKTFQHGYQFTMVSAETLPLMLIFDTRGLLSYVIGGNVTPITTPIVARIDSTYEPDYDCLILDRSRIRMGKYGKYDEEKHECKEK